MGLCCKLVSDQLLILFGSPSDREFLARNGGFGGAMARLVRAGQIGAGFGNGNQPLFTLHGSFSHAPVLGAVHVAGTQLGSEAITPSACRFGLI